MIEKIKSDFTGFEETEVSDIDFFAVDDEDIIVDENKNENLNPDEKKEGEEVKQEADLFEEAKKEETEETIIKTDDEGNKIPVVTAEEGDSLSALAYLKSKGLIEYELEEGTDLTENLASEILEDSRDDQFEGRIEELFNDLPDVVKELNKFAIKGGDVNVFLDALTKQGKVGITSDMDMTNEENQKLVVRHGLEEEGYDEEYITAQLEFLEDSKRLDKISATHYKKWENAKALEQKAILTSQDNKAKADKSSRRELKGKVATFLKDTESVTGFTVTAQDRRALPDYMSDRTVKLENGNQVTGMQKDLMRVLNSPTGSVQMAKLLKAANKEGELNFGEIKKETETKVIKKVRDNVRRNKQGIISQSGGSSIKSKKPLADYFN